MMFPLIFLVYPLYIISCTVRGQGTWKLVHGCGESCRPEPKLVHGCGESCRPEPKARGDMIHHSREQVSKFPAP